MNTRMHDGINAGMTAETSAGMNSRMNSRMNAKEWQARFAQSVFSDLPSDLAGTFSDRLDDPQGRFSIYQNNVFYSLRESLADTYPVIKKLVGDDFFKGTASAYIRQHPPEETALIHYGATFPQFLATFEHTQALVYLQDVAELELAWYRAYHATDKTVMTPDDFARITPEVFEQARVELHPSFHCLQSDYPIFTIWQANQDSPTEEATTGETNTGKAITEKPITGEATDGESTTEETIDVNCSESVILVRHDHGYQVSVFNVDQDTYGFYQKLQQGLSVGEALLAADIEITIENGSGRKTVAEIIALGIQNGFIHALRAIADQL